MKTLTMKSFLCGVFMVIFSFFLYADLPNEFTLEVFMSTYDSTDDTNYPLQGDFALTFQIIKSDGTVLYEKQQNIFVVLGILTINIEDIDNFVSGIFSYDILQAKITLEELSLNYTDLNIKGKTSNANLQSSESIIIPIHSLNRVILSNTSLKANLFLNEDLISLSEPSLNVAISTTNHVDTLHIDGNINASAFVGDASMLENLDYIRWVTLYERIYYDEGFVGIGLDDPSVHLHVSGNFLVNQNAETEVPPLLIVRNSLISTFSGAAQEITSFNASEFSSGALSNDRLFGDYSSTTGVGSINIGTWNASQIIDAHIRDNLTLNGSILHNFSIASTFTTLNDTNIFSHSSNHPFSIYSAFWSLSEDSALKTLNTPELSIGGSEAILNNTIHFRNQNNTIFSINTSGNVALFNADNLVEFNPSSAIQVGNSSSTKPGTIRLDHYFEGYSSSGWNRMDFLGNFTGYSLFKEDDLSTEVIKVHSNTMIGLNIKTPNDSFVVSGNVVFTGNLSGLDSSEDIITGNYLAWISNKAALRLGESDATSQKNTTANIGLYSVGIGDYAGAYGMGAINLTSSSSSDYYSNAYGDYSVIIGGNGSAIQDKNTIALSSEQQSIGGTSNIVMSSSNNGSSFSGNGNIFLNGTSSGIHAHNNTVVGGYLVVSALGDNSFLWESSGSSRSFTKNNHNTFTIAQSVKVGINTNEFDSSDVNESLVVNGKIKADYFEGFGIYLTGDIRTEYLKVLIDGLTEDVYPTHNISSNHIYISEDNGFLPENSVGGTSLSDGSITGTSFDGYILDTHKIEDNSISTDAFDDSSIVYDTLSGDDLDQTKFSAITGSDFEDDSIDETKLSTDSIYTIHFIDEAVTTDHILADTINAPSNNIALHAVTSADIVVELLISQYFANEGIDGFNIANEALYTTTDSTGIVESYFVWEDAGVAAPQTQEHHIASGAVRKNHIPNLNINSNLLSDDSIESADLTTNITAGIIVADDRTVLDIVFLNRHFADNALTNSTFDDECPASDCASPTENFQILTDQIADEAISFDAGGIEDEIATAAVLQDDINSKNIVGRHIKNFSIITSKFQDSQIMEEHLNRNSISTEKIANYSLQVEDFADKSIEGVHIPTGTITSRELDEDSISGSQIEHNSIDSSHIADASLGMSDFAPGAISNDKIADGSITAEDLIAGAITEDLISSVNLTEEKFATNSVSWDDFTQPPADYFPVEKLGDNSLNFDTQFTDEPLDAAKILENSIGATQLDIPTFSINKLATPLAVENGGTGITEFIQNALLYSYDDSGLTRMGQTDKLRYEFNSANGTGILFADPPESIPSSFTSGLITSGNVLIENGALILQSYIEADSSLTYTFLKFDSISQAIQTTYRQPLSYTDSNMNLKVKELLLNTGMIIGSGSALNGIDLTDGFALGDTFRSETPPTNGLIIESQLHIGGNYTSSSYLLGINEGNAYAVSDNIGAIFDITNSTDLSTPIQANGLSVIANAETGIVSEAPEPLNVIVSGSSSKTGIISTIIADASNYPLSGIVSIKPSLESHVGYANANFSAGIYGKEPTTTKTNNYSAYFDGDLGATSLTFDDVTPTHNLIVDSIKLEGLLGQILQDNIINTIDWTAGNIARISVDDNDRTITFSDHPEESALLMVVIEHVGSGVLTFASSDIAWFDDYEPELTNLDGRSDIVVFRYVSDGYGGGTYYGSALYNFYEPGS